MDIEFDEKKNQSNKAKHGVWLSDAENVDWSIAKVQEDTRYSYGERRFVALVYLNNELHSCCFTLRENALRIISFRKANLREVRAYAKI